MAQVTTLQPYGVPGRTRSFSAKTAAASVAIHILSTALIAPNHAADSGNNLLVAGDIEVQGDGWFDGRLTVTGNSVLGLNSAVFQPAAGGDSTTFLQIKNAAGIQIVGVDTTNKRMIVGAGSPGETLEVAGNIAVTGNTGDDVYIFNNAGNGIRIRSDSVTTQWWAQDDGPAHFGTVSNDDLHIRTNNNNRITIKSGAGSGYVGINEPDPHSRLEVNGAISSATLTFSTVGPTDNVDVSGINTLFIDNSSNNVTIGGFAGGVDGQVLYITLINPGDNNVTLEHNKAEATQKIFLHAGADETLNLEYGGWVFVCHGGVDWHDCSHERHV